MIQVAGEIKAPKRTLRNGAYLSVFIVTTLYVLVTTGLVSLFSLIQQIGL